MRITRYSYIYLIKTRGGGTESFTFIPCEKGITLIRMLYKRPWEKINAKEVLYEVTIED
jgi:predicted secreted protein